MSASTFFKGSVPVNYEKYSGSTLFEPYAQDLVERIKKDRMKDVLELACGTGRVTFHLAKLIPDDGVLYATDISNDMMNMARTRVTDKKIKWQIVDAQNIPFPTTCFDHVVCQFGIMFFQNKRRAFEEVNRVLTKEGKFIFSAWDTVQNNPRTVLIKRILEKLFDDVPEDLINSAHSFSNKEEIILFLEQAGFSNINITAVQKYAHYKSVDDIINAVTKSSLSSIYLSEKSYDQQSKFKKALKEEIVTIYGAENIKIPMQALVCEAKR